MQCITVPVSCEPNCTQLKRLKMVLYKTHQCFIKFTFYYTDYNNVYLNYYYFKYVQKLLIKHNSCSVAAALEDRQRRSKS